MDTVPRHLPFHIPVKQADAENPVGIGLGVFEIGGPGIVFEHMDDEAPKLRDALLKADVYLEG